MKKKNADPCLQNLSFILVISNQLPTFLDQSFTMLENRLGRTKRNSFVCNKYFYLVRKFIVLRCI